MKQNTVEKGPDVRYWRADTAAAAVAQAHTVMGWNGAQLKEGLRELHTCFLSSEWICLHVENFDSFHHRWNCNSEFYYFWAISSGVVLKSQLFFNTDRLMAFFKNFLLPVMSRQCSADLIVHIVLL